MSIASEIARLQQAKADLATSITNKGVTVPSSATLDDYPALVDSIQQGGTPLPYDAEVEYIGIRTSNGYTGTFYTDFVPTGLGNVVVARMRLVSYPTTSSYAIWFSARSAASARSYRMIRGTNALRVLVNNGHNDNNSTGNNFDVNTNIIYTIVLDGRTFQMASNNGIGAFTQLTTTTTGDENGGVLRIGDGNNTDGASTRGINLDFFNLTWFKNGVMVLDLIPVRKGQVAYLYDKVSGKLYEHNPAPENCYVLGSDV